MFLQKTTTIGDFEYTVTQLGAKTGRAVAARLAKVLAPLTKAESQDEGREALAELLSSINEADLTYLCDTFSARTSYRDLGDPSKQPELSQTFDVHFAGRYGAMLKWLMFCVEVNFSSFLDELGIELPTLEEIKAKAA